MNYKRYLSFFDINCSQSLVVKITSKDNPKGSEFELWQELILYIVYENRRKRKCDEY